jgi:DNA-directed RNA polymerase specialized sigma24 family protein
MSTTATTATSNENPITEWIEAVRHGDEQSAKKLWDCYFERLLKFARRQMSSIPGAVYDEEDTAISTFRILYSKLQQGSYADLEGRDEFWKLMLSIALRKINRRVDYEAAEKRQIPESHDWRTDEELIADIPRQALATEYASMLASLRDVNLERVVLWKLEGYTNEEIAVKLHRTKRTVQRMLNLIRELWKDLPQA